MMCKRERWSVPTLLEPEMSLSAPWKHLSATEGLTLFSVTDETFMLLPAKIYILKMLKCTLIV